MRYVMMIILLMLSGVLVLLQAEGLIKEETVNVLVWSEDYEESVNLAQEKELHVFMYFTGSDWCSWCFRLNDEVLVQRDFIRYANENLVMLKLDFPRNIEQPQQQMIKNRQLMEKYNVRGFPTVVILNSEGKEVARTGYQEGGSESYIKHLRAFTK